MMMAIDRRPSLSTPRLRLRPTVPADAPRIAALAGDRDVARMTTSIPYPLTTAQAGEFLARMEAADAAREAIFALETLADGLIGMLGFHPGDDPAPELGYWLGRPYWGHGYATEAVEAALFWAGEAWGKRYLLAGHFADNAASARVLIKAGFLYTGRVERRFSLARDATAMTRMMVWLA
jgi:RimJ/RimL family protein N-acetyltransferase